jgi:hypothetical protein
MLGSQVRTAIGDRSEHRALKTAVDPRFDLFCTIVAYWRTAIDANMLGFSIWMMFTLHLDAIYLTKDLLQCLYRL